MIQLARTLSTVLLAVVLASGSAFSLPAPVPEPQGIVYHVSATSPYYSPAAAGIPAGSSIVYHVPAGARFAPPTGYYTAGIVYHTPGIPPQETQEMQDTQEAQETQEMQGEETEAQDLNKRHGVVYHVSGYPSLYPSNVVYHVPVPPEEAKEEGGQEGETLSKRQGVVYHVPAAAVPYRPFYRIYTTPPRYPTGVVYHVPTGPPEEEGNENLSKREAIVYRVAGYRPRYRLYGAPLRYSRIFYRPGYRFLSYPPNADYDAQQENTQMSE